MAESTPLLHWPTIRRVGGTFVGLCAALALTLSFGSALVQGVSNPSLDSAEITSRAAAFVAGPWFQWSLRGTVVLLALVQGIGLARLLARTPQATLANAFVMAFGSVIVLVLLRLALDLIFGAPGTLKRFLFDAAGYVAAIGLALVGAWIGARAAGSLAGEAGAAASTSDSAPSQAE